MGGTCCSTKPNVRNVNITKFKIDHSEKESVNKKEEKILLSIHSIKRDELNLNVKKSIENEFTNLKKNLDSPKETKEESINSNMLLVNNKKSEILVNSDYPNTEDTCTNTKLNLNKKREEDPDYIAGRLIGKGRFGSVYSGLSSNSGQIIAIKIYDLSENKMTQQIVEAVNKLKKINHNNLINTISVPQFVSGNPLPEFRVIYDFCNGSSVKILLEKYGEFDEKLIKKYVKEILTGLQYLHSLNIVHSNIKSSNILVDGNGTIRISDILIEGVLMMNCEEGLKEKLSKSEDIPYWVSPDLFTDKLEKDNMSDFWSLGCLIIEMATRKSAWCHYTFKSSTEFVNFISTTNLIPPLPKKLSKTCHNFLSLLFSRVSKVRAEDLLEHEFFSVTNESSNAKDSQTNLRKISVDTNKTNSQNATNPLVHKSANVVNIFHNPNSNDDAHLFSVTMTVASDQTPFNNLCENQSQNGDTVAAKKVYIPQNILEEIDASQENSPNVKEKDYFEFNSECENTYNYIHAANQSMLQKAITVQVDDESKYTSVEEFSKFNNFQFTTQFAIG